MAFFKKKTPSAGLGRSVSMDGQAAETMVIENDVAQSLASVVGDRDREAEIVMNDVRPMSKAEKRSEAKAAKENAKANKIQPMSRKARAAENAALSAASDDARPSNKVFIDFYPGMAKADAIATAQHWATTHMDLPSMCFYYVEKLRDGYAVEVQEGVGKAYLPSAIELAQSNPGRIVVIPMIRRKMTITYAARLGEFEAQVLPEMVEPPVIGDSPPIQAVRGPAMTPVMKQYYEWMYVGRFAAIIGGISFLASLTFYAIDPAAKVPPEWRTTDISLLPVMQWSRLQPNSQDSYVTRFEFQDGQWRVVRQSVGASVDLAAPIATGTDETVVGGAVAAPASATPSPTGGASIPPPAGVPSAAGQPPQSRLASPQSQGQQPGVRGFPARGPQALNRTPPTGTQLPAPQ